MCAPPLSAANGQRGAHGRLFWERRAFVRGDERAVVGNPHWLWRSWRTFFECGCGAQLTLSDRLDHTEANKRAEIGAAASCR